MKYYFLIFCLFASLSKPFAQISNEAAYQQLLSGFLQKQAQPILSLEAEWPSDWRPEVRLDSSASLKVTVGELDISYAKISPQKYKRELALSVSMQDSSFRSEILIYTDSLSKAQLRQLRAKSKAVFKGDAPGTLANVVRPITFVTGSLAALFSLFYIRSR